MVNQLTSAFSRLAISVRGRVGTKWIQRSSGRHYSEQTAKRRHQGAGAEFGRASTEDHRTLARSLDRRSRQFMELFVLSQKEQSQAMNQTGLVESGWDFSDIA